MDFTEAYDIAHLARCSLDPVSSPSRAAVEVLVADITDRRGLKWEWNKIDATIRAEIMEVWGRIIDATTRPPAKPKSAVKYGCSLCGNLSFDMYTAHAADRNYHAEAFELFAGDNPAEPLVLHGLRDAVLTPARQKILERIEAGDIDEDCGP